MPVPVASLDPMKKAIKPKYRRVLLKLSGEALGGETGVGICPEAVHDMARQIGEVRELGVEVVVVIGGGNIFRGLAGSERGIELRHGRLCMGMLATIINSLALQDALGKRGHRHTRADRDHHGNRRSPRPSSDEGPCGISKQRPCRDLRRRHRKPVFLD